MNDSSPHLEAGSTLPELKKETLRIYSMLYCPFAQRTRMVLVHKNIPVEVVNVHLKKKPDWFLERNPVGLVPVLEKDGQVVYESAICNEYLDDVYPQKRLQPEDPYLRARHKMLMDAFGKLVESMFKFRRASEEEKKSLLDGFHSKLQRYENVLQEDFFGGDDLCMVDIHLWPFFERFGAWEELTGYELLPADRFPKLTAWVQRMLEQPAVKGTWHESRYHAQLFKNYDAGDPKYDDLFS